MSQPPQPTPGEPKKRRLAEPKKMRRRFTGGPPVIKKFSARAGPRRIPDSAELGAMHVVMKSGAILPQGPQHKDFYKTVNLLLTCSAELEVVAVEVDNLEERRPLLDGVAAALDQALPLLKRRRSGLFPTIPHNGLIPYPEIAAFSGFFVARLAHLLPAYRSFDNSCRNYDQGT